MSRPRSFRVCKGQITADLIAGRRGDPDGWDSRPACRGEPGAPRPPAGPGGQNGPQPSGPKRSGPPGGGR